MLFKPTRLLPLALAASLVLTACGGGGGASDAVDQLASTGMLSGTSSVPASGAGAGAGAGANSTGIAASSDGAIVVAANDATSTSTTSIAPVQTTPTWVQCANENFYCTFSGTRDVRYGADGKFATLRLTEATECNNATFGDPTPGKQKSCSVLVDVPVKAASAEPVQLGVYLGAECKGAGLVPGYGAWLGRPQDRGLDFLSNETWEIIENASGRGTWCWKPTGLPMTLSVPMLPADGGKSTLAEGATGAYNQHFKVVAENFVKNGQANAIVRLGWEFNFGWYPWAASPDPKSWVLLWRQIVTTMRSVPGQNFKFDWCPGMGQGALDSARVYPGDDYVDIIGMDVYNQIWVDPRPTNAWLWTFYTQQWFGMNWQRDLGLAHHKPLSYPEWGTGTRPDGHGLGDDPVFVQSMIDWIASNNVVYFNYWDYDAPDYNAKLSNGNYPLSGAVFRKAYGK